jgi:hypothetical protein
MLWNLWKCVYCNGLVMEALDLMLTVSNSISFVLLIMLYPGTLLKPSKDLLSRKCLLSFRLDMFSKS